MQIQWLYEHPEKALDIELASFQRDWNLYRTEVTHVDERS